MSLLESRMRTLGLLTSPPAPGNRPFLPDYDKTSDSFHTGGIEDDHIPFMARGVDILHIIPSPFPHVWHTMDDDGEHLDSATVEDLAKIVTAFAAQWLDLEGHLLGGGEAPAQQEAKRSVLLEKTEL